MRTADFHYELPPELIAQHPAPQRDGSRLLVFQRPGGTLLHGLFTDLLTFLKPGDVLVLNDSRVIPARLRARNARTEGEFEVLLLEEFGTNDWWAMMRPGKRARPETELGLLDRAGQPTSLTARVIETNAEGHRRLRFQGATDVSTELDRLGEIPLPPYIKRKRPNQLPEDWERYQTVYAQAGGSVAAPTAGLHFTPAVLDRARQAGLQVAFVTLHVGLGTFAPVKSERLEEHTMHEERFVVPEETARQIATARQMGGRIVAVGTTSLRVLESVAAAHDGEIVAGSRRTKIFIHPPYHFRAADALLTNFHLPCSTLLMLVSAFAAPGEERGRTAMLAAYAEAVRERYRFFSYGDAMLIL